MFPQEWYSHHLPLKVLPVEILKQRTWTLLELQGDCRTDQDPLFFLLCAFFCFSWPALSQDSHVRAPTLLSGTDSEVLMKTHRGFREWKSHDLCYFPYWKRNLYKNSTSQKEAYIVCGTLNQKSGNQVSSCWS